MSPKLADILRRADHWPERAQQSLVEIALEIEAGLQTTYRATPEELEAIDEAEAGGIATDAEVAAAFRLFRPA